jgi:LPS-assembly protein
LPSLRRKPIAAAVLLAIAPAAWSEVPVSAEPPIVLRLERELGAGRSTVGRDGALFVRAEKITYEDEERVVLEGRAEIRRGGLVLRGDRVIYTRATDELEVQGSARAFGEGLVITGPLLRYRIGAETGTMPDARFSYPARNATGSARDIELLGDGRACMREATYTTCDPDNPAWWVRANELEIEQGEELAIARGARLYFQGVPILASPYAQIPLNDSRRTGLLVPSLSLSSRVGWDLKVPFYWNIAPNRDATITSRMMTKRGVLFENEFRYLEPNWRGTAQFDVIPHDRAFGSSRNAMSLRHEYANRDGISGGWNYNRVSDDSYLSDFGTSIVTTSRTVLPQEAFVGYNRTYWNTAVRVTKNQSLVTPTDPTNPTDPNQKPYERVPQFTLNGARFDVAGFDLSVQSELTRFGHPTLQTGDRLIVNPVVSYPLLAPGYFVVPKAQWNGAIYDNLDPVSPPDAKRQTRSVPMLSLDSGLIFERDTTWFDGQAALQTLEPRLYYAYVPFREQNELPDFDTAEADFNFAQLFRENIYVGGDRIGQANQLTAALTSRLLDPQTGGERLRAAIGQRFYFSPQNVTLPGGTPRTGKASDLLVGFSGAPWQFWQAEVAAQYSTQQSEIVRAVAAVRYRPRPASALSLAYRYKANDFEQIDLGVQWPLAKRWYAVARINYSILDNTVVEVLAGIEYKADCWLLRLVPQRYVTPGTNVTTTSVFLQLELFGLGSIQTGASDLLRRNIPGYQTINPPPREPGRFEFYE